MLCWNFRFTSVWWGLLNHVFNSFCSLRDYAVRGFLSTIWKSPHRHLGSSIGIDVGIGIGIANFFFSFEALIFAFRSFLWSKISMMKSFTNTLESFPGSVCCCLEQLFCRDVVSACFLRKELCHARYLRSFKNTQSWKLQLACLCKEPY